MPRNRRKESATGMYHVVGRGINKLSIFHEAREKSRILRLVEEHYEKYSVQIYAYCIMPNHFHLLVKAELYQLSSFMAKVLASFANYYNYKHKRTGYVFQGRYRSQCIESEGYYWNCVRYIHMNPVQAGIIRRMSGFRHSSIHEYTHHKTSKFKMVHDEAFIMKTRRFSGNEEFLGFHKMSSQEIFADITEEEIQQKKIIAREILHGVREETKQPFEEIFDYIKLREELDKRIKETLKLSKRETAKIRNVLRAEIVKI